MNHHRRISPVTVMFCAAIVFAGCVTSGGGEGNEAADGITLKPADLYGGLDARFVVLDKDGAAVRLDSRVFKFLKEYRGWVVTDPIALVPALDGIEPAGTVGALEVEAAGDIPDGTEAILEVRTGPHPLSEEGWSAWQKVGGLKGSAPSVAGRYAQVRITLQTSAEGKLPGITSLVLRPRVAAAAWKKAPKATEDKTQKIVKSTIEFKYERMNHPKLARLRKLAKLDEVVADAKDDFDALVKLTDWVASSSNNREKGWKKTKHYPWDWEHVMSIPEGKPEERVIYGHCLSYCEVMLDVSCAMGYKGRHVSIMGFRKTSHEVPEIWVPSLGKWVHFDPSLAFYYYDLETKTPMNVLEIHNLLVKTFLADSEKDMYWFSGDSPKSKVKKIGSKSQLGCRMGGYAYGAPMKENYNWGWSHGWITHGVFQITPRNDVYTRADVITKGLGSYPGYNGFPFWVDEKTPPKKGVRTWYTRARDLYWSLDQASFVLAQGSKEGTLVVLLGNSMPFFKSYAITIDGKEVSKDGPAPASIEWALKSGKNTLEVVPVNEFGARGAGSSVVVEY